MYQSPIEIIQGQLRLEMENNILRAVQEQDIRVDKHELLRALQYDRNQYEAGYLDGKAHAVDELVVRCEECIQGSHVDCPEGRVWCDKMCRYMVFEGYCSYGERRKNGK